MRFFLQSLRAALSSRVRDWRLWALLLLPSFLTLAAGRVLPPEEVSAPVQVGVVLPEEGGEAFWLALQNRSGTVVAFRSAALSEARRQVALGRWDCALLLPEDFQERLEERDLYGLIQLLTGPASTAYPLVREAAASCVIQCVSPYVAEDYLLDSGVVEREEAEALFPRLRETLPSDAQVRVSLKTADGRPLDPLVLAEGGVSRLLWGITAAVLMVCVLLAAMDLGRWLETPFALRLAPLRGRMELLLPRLGSALLPLLPAGGLALLAGERSLPPILALFPYLLFWGAAALALVWRRPLWRALPALLPFLPVLGLLLSPALLDPSALFPGLAPLVRWNPVTLYLRACGGSWGDGLVLALAGVGILVLLARSE